MYFVTGFLFMVLRLYYCLTFAVFICILFNVMFGFFMRGWKKAYVCHFKWFKSTIINSRWLPGTKEVMREEPDTGLFVI